MNWTLIEGDAALVEALSQYADADAVAVEPLANWKREQSDICASQKHNVVC